MQVLFFFKYWISARNGTFVIKGEIKINFSSTPNKKPKLKNWVNTTLNWLVVQVEPSSRFIKTETFNFTFVALLLQLGSTVPAGPHLGDPKVQRSTRLKAVPTQ